LGAAIRTADGLRDIVEIVIVGVVMPYGIHPSQPLKQYTLFEAKAWGITVTVH